MGGGLVVFLVGLVQSVFQYLDLLVQVILIFGPRIHTQTVLALLSYLFLEVVDVEFDVFLGFLLALDCRVDLCDHLLFSLDVKNAFTGLIFILVHFGLN